MRWRNGAWVFQAKDVNDRIVLEFLERLSHAPPGGRWANWCQQADGEPWARSVLRACPYGTPPKVALAKMRRLMRRGLVTGCGCGCRGDFEITDLGRHFLSGGRVTMNRAERRRAAREHADAEGRFQRLGNSGQTIQLQNPVTDHFPAFIFGNATRCDRVAELDSAKGQHLILCGAGPSLRDHAAAWCPRGDQVWGCNSAATWLHAQGLPVTHGFTVDQTPHMVAEWKHAPPSLEYLLASSCHPHLAELLESRGARVTWFHNYCGVRGLPVRYTACEDCGAILDQPPDGVRIHGAIGTPGCQHARTETRTETYEEWLYMALYPPTIRCGAGLNSVNRALDLAKFMGFARITILGADNAIRVTAPCPPDAVPGSPAHTRWLQECTVMHADGGSAIAHGASGMTLDGTIDGRRWTSKPDMLPSALDLEIARRHEPGRIEIIGDVLPNALWDKPVSYLARLPQMTSASTGRPILDLVPPTLTRDPRLGSTIDEAPPVP